MKQNLLKIIFFLCLISIGAFCYFYFYDYINIDSLQKYHLHLSTWIHSHPILAVIIFISVYILAATCCMPGISLLSVCGGFLFGPIGFIYVVLSKIVGAYFVFELVKNIFGDWVAKYIKHKMVKMDVLVRKNAFNYFLFLRLIPIFPFWVVNVSAALLEIPKKIFLLSTALGILPGAFVFVWLGHKSSQLIYSPLPSLQSMLSPSLLIPFILLGLLWVALRR